MLVAGFYMLVPTSLFVTNIGKLSPTDFVTNIDLSVRAHKYQTEPSKGTTVNGEKHFTGRSKVMIRAIHVVGIIF